jgi:hypothetical protein
MSSPGSGVCDQQKRFSTGQLMALLEQVVHLLHSLRLLGRLAESEVTAAAAPARVGKVFSVPKSGDVHGHEELGRDLALGALHATVWRACHIIDSREIGAEKTCGAAARILPCPVRAEIIYPVVITYRCNRESYPIL